MISKLKFDEQHVKKNILLIKIIGQIVDAIELPRAIELVRQLIREQGFEEFHRKMLDKEGKKTNIKEDSDSEEDDIIKSKAFNRYNNEI